MSVFHHSTRTLRHFGIRNIVHGRSKQHRQEPLPVRLSFASYEDTKTRNSYETLSNPPLLIMHGHCGSRNNWASISKALQRRTNPTRKIIAVDARNHGESDHSKEHTIQALASDVKEFLIAERTPRVAFLGHSMGGIIGMYLALRYPGLIERLIVVDTSPISSKSARQMRQYFEAMAAINLPPTPRLSTARAMADAALMPTVPDKGLRTFLIMNLVLKQDGRADWRLNLRALRENITNLDRFPVEAESGQFYPGFTTFIAGETSDHILPTDHAKMKLLFPNSEFHTVAGAGHWVHSEKPAETVKLILNALSKHTKKT